MKKLLFSLLAIALAGCIPAMTQVPTSAPPPVPPTPQVIIATVLVTVIPTEAPTQVPPTSMPVPPPTETPTQASVPAAVTASGPFAVDNTMGGGVFKDISYSSDSFTLRCYPLDITIKATAISPYIVNALLYYRIEDRQSLVDNITEWKNAGEMQSDNNGNFSMVFSGQTVHPDLRKAKAWWDFQIVGVNKLGDVVGRTEKIVQKVAYSIDCP